jgi:recombination protein RecA
MGTELGLVGRSGCWYAYGGEKIGEGRENARLYLRELPEIVQKVESSIFERLHIVRNLGQRAQKQETNS